MSGMADWRPVHLRLEPHEWSMAHRACAEAYCFNASDLKGKEDDFEETRKSKIDF